MKICRDCKHCVNDQTDGDFEYAKCIAPKNIIKDPISGGSSPRWIFCSTHRSDWLIESIFSKTCGLGGRWFEPRRALN